MAADDKPPPRQVNEAVEAVLLQDTDSELLILAKALKVELQELYPAGKR